MNKFRRKVRPTAVMVPFLVAVFGVAIGASIGISWTKAEVIPVVLVKPGIGDFVPLEGSSIGNTWRKEGVVPVMLVEPSAEGFVPIIIASGDKAIENAQQTAPVFPSVIESQIDGDFEGWEVKTIVKLMKGQIWQQSEYHFHYHYAFMPKVVIFRSGSGYKMIVDRVDKAVAVRRLK